MNLSYFISSRLRYYIERYYPITLSILVGILLYLILPFKSNFDKIILVLTDVSFLSIPLIGFQLIALTLINTINTKRMNFIKSSGSFGILISYLKWSIYSNLILFISTIAIKLINQTYLICIGFIVTFIFAILTNFRFIRIFIKLSLDSNHSK